MLREVIARERPSLTCSLYLTIFVHVRRKTFRTSWSSSILIEEEIGYRYQKSLPNIQWLLLRKNTQGLGCLPVCIISDNNSFWAKVFTKEIPAESSKLIELVNRLWFLWHCFFFAFSFFESPNGVKRFWTWILSASIFMRTLWHFHKTSHSFQALNLKTRCGTYRKSVIYYTHNF